MTQRDLEWEDDTSADSLPHPQEAPGEKYRRLPPAIPIATTVAIVGVVPQIPVGPEGAGGGGDGD